MKKELFLLAFSLSGLGAMAGPRSFQEAKDLAHDFVLHSRGGGMFSSVDMSYVSFDATVARSPQLYQAYYIFNVGEGDGFVIVSGDDQARAILGYGDSGTVDWNHLPPNVRFWLDTYQREMELLADEPESSEVKIYDGGVEHPGKVVVAPLLKGIEWDQFAPYNLLCPKDGTKTTLTGCAATAMAMVMKVHNYPEQGTGSFSYKTETRKLAVDVTLGKKIDWESMRDTYQKTDKDKGAQAVAQLMYEVGATLEMDYNTSDRGGSGANIFSQQTALIQNFGYNKNMYYLGRDYTSAGEWQDKVMEELNAGRPLLYTGISDAGGHAFVCDGYTDAGYFHFNWGWSGMYNGYYAFSSLEPGVGGSGAGAGVYNDFQFILVGVQPEEMGAPYSCFYLDGTNGIEFSKTALNRTDVLEARVTKFSNFTADFKGKLGLGIFQNGKFVDYVGKPETKEVNLGAYFKTFTIKGNLPADLEDGTYVVAFCSQTKDEETPTMNRPLNGTIGHMLMEVTKDEIKLTEPSTSISLEQPEPLKLMGKAAVNGKVKFEVSIQNNGSDFYDEIGVYIKSVKSLKPSARLTKIVKIPANESVSLDLSGILPSEINIPGEYVVRVTYKDGGKWKLMSKDKGAQIQVEAEGSSIEEMSVDEPFQVRLVGDAIQVLHAVPGQKIELYTLDGTLREIAPADSEGKVEFRIIHSGLYLVRQGKHTVKVAF